MSLEEMAREACARLALAKFDCKLSKTPARSLDRRWYGVGYQIEDDRNCVVLGCARQYELDMEQVGDFHCRQSCGGRVMTELVQSKVESLPLIPFVSLDQRAELINRLINKADFADAKAAIAATQAGVHRVQAGKELLEVKALLPHGGWLPWCRENIHRSIRDVQKLLKIASAADPGAALETERETRRDGMREARANTAHVGRISEPVPEPEIIDAEAVEVIDATPAADLAPSLEQAREARAERDAPYVAPAPMPVDTPAELMSSIRPVLDAWSDDDFRAFQYLLTCYKVDRYGDAMDADERAAALFETTPANVRMARDIISASPVLAAKVDAGEISLEDAHGHCHINRFYCSLLASPLDPDSINSTA